ncbi:hypothetical protein KS4_15000 [Poriferisphaera corsica]|uniref:Uncharacterized protein n=1 Tax=Poriferisphaera corsica TaxID=2528020 RepID=A0A517YTG4_9BACT|nr:hypothetical protein [Poriferisphaera corsica]QDU33452.1 hypothetical protein KS4_15000 [Poriferisphaera corsica]
MKTTLPILLLLILTAFFSVGCASMATTPQQRQELAAIPYPADAQYAPNPDIVAQREGHNLRLINRTPWEYTDIQLWINQQYVKRIDTIKIGTNNLYSLETCINEFEQPFPTGTFLKPERSFPVVLTELYDPISEKRYRLNSPPVRDDPGLFW